MTLLASLVLRLAPYITNFSIAASNALLCATLLEGAIPAGATAEQKRCLRKVRARAEAVQGILGVREAATRVMEPRRAVINAWLAIYQSLDAASRLPGGKAGRGRRCAELRDAIFPVGTEFTRANVLGVWSASSKILQRIDGGERAGDVANLLAPEFLATARKEHEALGDAIAANGEAPIREAKQAFMDAVFDYTRSLVGDVRSDDQASIDRFFAAVAPLDTVRVTRSSGSNEDAPPVPSDAPAPEPSNG